MLSSLPKTPPKSNRPQIRRSSSAATDFLQDQAKPALPQATTAQQAARKLHLPLTHSSDHSKRHGDKHRTGNILAKKSPGSGHASGSSTKPRSDGKGSGASQAPVAEAEAAPGKLPHRLVRPEDVMKERHRRTRRDEELRSTLGGLSDLAHNATRQLDNVFYSIMEKVSTLRSTIASLQDLTVQSAKLHQDFQSEAVSVENEYKDQINHFSEFEDQQDRVRTLEDRIQKGVTKTQSLSDRLEASRKRAELWEKRENEWQARTSMRLKLTWGCCGAAVILLLALLALRQAYKVSHRLHHPTQNVAVYGINDSLLQEMRVDFSEVVTPATAAAAAAHAASSQTSRENSSTRLAIFDEL